MNLESLTTFFSSQSIVELFICIAVLFNSEFSGSCHQSSYLKRSPFITAKQSSIFGCDFGLFLFFRLKIDSFFPFNAESLDWNFLSKIFTIALQHSRTTFRKAVVVNYEIHLLFSSFLRLLIKLEAFFELE